MKEEKLLKPNLTTFGNQKFMLMMVVCIGMILSFIQGTVFSQVQEEKEYKIVLKSRSFTPEPGIRLQVRDRILAQLRRREPRHVYVQFFKLPNRAIKQRLATKGIRLLSYISSNSYYATVERPEALVFDSPEAKRDPALSLIRWIGQIEPADRVEPDVLAGKFGKWAINPDGTVKIRVMFFEDVDSAIQIEFLKKYTNKYKQHSPNIWQLDIQATKIESIIQDDAINWIKQEPPPYKHGNDVTRNLIGVNAVQGFDITVPTYNGYSGDGIQVMIWDTGVENHNDFQGRILATNNPWPNSCHGTHVAGIFGGSGIRSNMNDDDGNWNGGTAYQWRGMAPNIEYVGHDMGWSGAGYSNGITNHGVDITNHSHTQGQTSTYGFDAITVENVVRNDTLYIVTCAMNNGNIPQYGALEGYYSIIGSVAKNSLSIGSFNSGTGRRSNFSSMGPTFDGRIKPDLMAPGHNIRSTVYDDTDPNHAAYHDNGYGLMSGTSMASPCVAGVIALMLEAFWDTYGDDNPRPLYSTMKAILIETAEDMVQAPNVPGEPDSPDFVGANAQPPFFHAGPDWATGYGLIDAEEAVSMIREKSLYLQGSIDDIGDIDEIPIYIPPGATEDLKVTLVWDDHPGSAATPNTTSKLVNDLNLKLIEPDGITEHEPWILSPLDPADDGDIDPADIIAATTGEDHLNNVEQVQVANPPSGIWIARVDESGLPQPTQSYSLASNFAFTRRDLAVVQAIDRTGSMDYYGYIKPAKEKAKLFIDLMQPEEQVGIISFATSCGNVTTAPTVDYPLTTISPAETEKTGAKNAVDVLVAEGCTPIGGGMQLAQNKLNTATAGFKRAMILLSDGYENREPWVANVLPTIPAETDIYTIALGTTVDETLLQDIAVTSGGEYYNSPTIEDLQKIYLKLHGAVGGVGSLAFEEGELTGGAVEEEELQLDQYTKEATFVATWLNPADNLTVKLYDPNNNLVTTNPSVKIYSDDTYRAYRITNPTSGKWRMQLTGTSVLSAKADYVVAGFVDSELRLNILPHLVKFLTGDRVLIVAKIESEGTPVINADVRAKINRPIYWAGNVLAAPKVHGYTLSKKQLLPSSLIQPTVKDSLSIAAQRFFKIVSDSTQNLLGRERFEIELYDDGTHGDEKPNDGIYANYLAKTDVGGDYNVTINVSCSISGKSSTREEFFSLFNAINIHPKHSTINVTYLSKSADGIRYKVKIVPLDRFGNYLGPGHTVSVLISYPGSSRQVKLGDNIDGTYTKEIFLSQNEVDAGAELEIVIDGIKFTTAELPKYKKHSISLHSGTAVPTGTFANDFDLGFNVLLDADYHFTPQLSIVGLFGYNNFRSKTSGVDDTHWINLSANLKYRLLNKAVSPYINGGLGYYIPKTGDKGLGANLGFGLNYDFSSSITFEVGADYHAIFGEDVQFLHSHAGIILKF